MSAKGKESPHHDASPGGVWKFATDHMFMCEDGTPITILAGYDGKTRAFFANVVPCKDTSHAYAEKALAHNVLSTSHHKVIQQSDQEPSILDVKHKAGAHIPTGIVYEESPVGDSNANGSIEQDIQTIQGQIRAIKDYTERQIGATIGLDSTVLKWLVRHAAWTLTTFHIGSDGKTAHQLRGKPLNQQIAAFDEQILFKPHKTAGPLQKLAVNWMDGCWLDFNTRTGEHIVRNNVAVVTCRSIRRRNKEERWDRERLLGIIGNPWSLQDGRVEVDPDPAAPARYIPMVNPKVKAEPTATKPRNEEYGRRIYITKKMVSESGATLGCKGCFMIGQPHTEECRTRITARMEGDPVLAKRLEDSLNRRNERANPETIVTVPNVSKTDATKRARHSELKAPRESANTGGASSSSAQADVDMRLIHAGKRQSEPDDDADMVCGLDVCDELDETHFTDTYINDCDGDYTDEATGATLRRDDVAKARMEEMKWYEKFSAFEEVTDETCVSRTGRKPFPVNGKTSIRATANAWKYEVDR